MASMCNKINKCLYFIFSLVIASNIQSNNNIRKMIKMYGIQTIFHSLCRCIQLSFFLFSIGLPICLSVYLSVFLLEYLPLCLTICLLTFILSYLRFILLLVWQFSEKFFFSFYSLICTICNFCSFCHLKFKMCFC